MSFGLLPSCFLERDSVQDEIASKQKQTSTVRNGLRRTGGWLGCSLTFFCTRFNMVESRFKSSRCEVFATEFASVDWCMHVITSRLRGLFLLQISVSFGTSQLRYALLGEAQKLE